MTKLTLSPEAAAARAARRAAKAASAMPAPAAEPPTPPSASPRAFTPPLPRTNSAEIEAKCRACWPALFDPADPKPLALGIHARLKLALGERGCDIRAFLAGWVAAPAYHHAVATGTLRYDLDGSTTYITPEQVAYATERAGSGRKATT